MTVKQNELAGWIGHTLVDQSGDKIGKIVDLYADEATGQPEWIAVNTGRFGSKVNFVPLAGAERAGDDLRVPYAVDQVKDAPKTDPDGQLSQEDEARLYGHFGFDYDLDDSPTGLPRTGGDTRRSRGGTRSGGRKASAAAKGRDTSGPTTDDAMTRSEEELRVGTERREAGRARLRKYVVTEDETVTVPVSKEKVQIEREPITDENVERAMDGPAISEEEHEVILHEERPVVGKEAVAKERVRLDTENVTEERQVTEEVRKERIEAEGDDPRRGR
ncbi:MAG TPA: PRC and DUF2382 domain-containing protein [Acidimicrobiales bacterium]